MVQNTGLRFISPQGREICNIYILSTIGLWLTSAHRDVNSSYFQPTEKKKALRPNICIYIYSFICKQRQRDGKGRNKFQALTSQILIDLFGKQYDHGNLFTLFHTLFYYTGTPTFFLSFMSHVSLPTLPQLDCEANNENYLFTHIPKVFFLLSFLYAYKENLKPG